MAQPSPTTTLHHSLERNTPHSGIALAPLLTEQSLMQALQTSDTPQHGLLQIAQLLGDAFRADICMIGLRDQFQTLTQSIHWSTRSPATFAHDLTDVLDILGHLVYKEQLLSTDPVALSNIQAIGKTLEPECIASLLQGSTALPPIKSILVVQTVFQGSINGIILLARSQPYEWTESEIQQLKTVSLPVSIAISQMQLQHQVQQQTRYQSLISQLTTAVRGSCELEQIFQSAIAGLVSTLHLTRGFILLFKYSDPLFKMRSVDAVPKAKATVECQYPLTCDLTSHDIKDEAPCEVDLCAGTWAKQSFWLSECEFCQQLFLEDATAVVIPNHASLITSSADTTQRVPHLSPIFNLGDMPSLLLVPLENQGTILGCLVLQHERQRFWQSEELSVVTLIAAQLSTAIMQNRTLRQVQSLVDERTAQLQRSLDVQAKLYEKTRQQVDQLRRLNRIMEEFLSTMSHELLTPLTSMTLAIRMLRQAKLSPEQQARYLDILERQCAQETSLINDLLALQQLESGATVARFQPLDVRYPIRDVVQLFEETWAKKNLTLAIDLPPRAVNLYTDSDSLNRILTELLTNAGKYATPGTTIHLQVSYQIEDQVGKVVLQLSNHGSGITDEEMPYIFDKFRRGQGVTQQAIPGTGLGLALVKGLVEHLNGTITASSIPLESGSSWETCFTLTLPQSPDAVV
jgi:signal transduction histidine kinase